MKQKLLFILALLCAIAQGAWADTWDGSLSKPAYYSDYKGGEVINTWWSMMVADYHLSDGHTYLVKGPVDLDDDRVYIDGNVVLVLTEGCTLNCDYGIEVGEGKTLTIEGPGTLNVKKGSHESAGIGAYHMGTLIINGGTINVTGGDYGAGIGGSKNNINGGRIVINGGVVNAHGGWGGAGIGGGFKNWNGTYGVCGDITINGGQVTAIAGEGSCSVGHGSNGSGGGQLTLGWTNPSDYFQCGKVEVSSVRFADGKQFVLDGTTTIATTGNINDKKIVPYVAVPALPGNGTAANPYTIGSADEWNRFAESVQYSNSYSGKHVKLTADISVNRKCGYVTATTPVKAFSGTFDGNGKTITATISDKHNQGTALFSYINGATIRNLTVTGTIMASQSHTSGLVGFADGTNLIEGCTVTTTLNVGSDYAGGIVGHGLKSATTIKDCIFAGTIAGTDGNRANIGGIWGWSTEGTPTLQNCLEKGTYTNIRSMHPMGLQNDKGTISQCFYLNETFGNPANACSVSGAYLVRTTAIDGEIFWQQRLMDGLSYYVPCLINNLDEFYELKDASVSITPTVTLLNGTPLSLGNDFTITIDGADVTTLPLNVTTTGRHTLAISGKGNYAGTKNITFTVVDKIVGDGSKDNPYLVNTVEHWSLFATLVNNGTDFSGLFVRLGNDITVTAMAGASRDKAFKGTFDGNGHTLTFNGGSASQPFGEDYCAPFRFVSDATIHDLKVAGNIYTFKKFAAGIVGLTSGKTAITGCQAGTVIHSSTAGDGTHGGLVALANDSLTIADCIFNGRLLTSNNTQYCGGFVGWHSSKAISITSSLYAPDTTIAGTTAESPINHGATFVRGDNAGAYCYYTESMGDVQGKQVFTAQPDGELCVHAQAADGKTYYLPCNVSGIKASFTLKYGSTSISPVVTGVDKPLVLGTDYTATLNGNAVTSFPITITSKGSYTLALTGNTADCTGTKSITFDVYGQIMGEGTKENPYLISSTSDWALFAANVADSLSYSGQYVKLMADIDITLPVGVREDKPFCGIFDGNGHTITASISSTTVGTGANEQGVAPFHYVKNATIKNLTVGGTIASASYHTAGLVGFADGTNLIENCTVTVTLNVSSNYAGGFVGHGLNSATTIRDCIFAGTINGVDGDRANMGGIWGWSDSATPVLENCMEKGTYTNISSMHPIGLQNDKGTLSHCYYLSPVIATPSHACTVSGAWQVYATDSGNDIYEKVKAVDSNSYFLPCTVSGVAKIYQHTGSDITILEPVITAADSTKLIAGTDFTYSPETVREKGDYTLTISGKGSYSGTKTMAFSVTDDMFVTSESTILSSGKYMVNENVTVNERINIRGNVVLNLGEGTTLYAPKGIELSKGNALTINGPGKLLIDQAAREDAGIGAVEVGTLVINGGTIKVTCYGDAAAIGGSKDNVSGGSITINGGVVSLVSLTGPAIGGGRRTKEGHYGVCGDIVINGGQVDAVSLLYLAIGPGANTDDTSGTLKLGWTNPGDFVRISNTLNRKWQLESVTFAEGCAFVIQGTTTIATAENLRNNRIEPLLALADNSDNSTMLATRNGMQLPAALTGRTLYKDGKWNTICLPFDLTLSGSPLDGAVARPLTEASISGTTLNLTFGDTVTTLQAGTPYIIKWAKASDYVDDDAHNIISPVFSSVTIDATDRSYDNGQTGNDCVRFLGTYDAKSFTAADENSILLMGANNTLRYAGEGASLGACRAYFKIGVDGASQTRSITSFSIDFGDGEGETTGIVTVSKESEGKGASEGWYTLDGRRLPAKPTRAGVYINNGKKVVVK